MKSLTHFPAPNIVPGVNLTAARFTEIYAWITTLTADTAQSVRNPYQYGLTLAYDGKPSLALEKVGTKLVLSRCSGVTPAGSVIGLFEDLHPAVVQELNERELHPQEIYGVWIFVDHKNHRVFGPESADLPLRPLYAAPSYQVTIQPVAQKMSLRPDGFPVGTLKMEYGAWKLTDYLPPCTHIGAHPELSKRYRNYTEDLEKLLSLFPETILSTDTYQEKAMLELRELTLQMGVLLSARRFSYCHLGPGGNPFDMIELWASFARQTAFLLQCLKDRPGFYNILAANTKQRNGVFFTAQSWEAAIQSLAGLQYDHNDLLSALATIDRFLEMVVPVIAALSYGVTHIPATQWEQEQRKEYLNWDPK